MSENLDQSCAQGFESDQGLGEQVGEKYTQAKGRIDDLRRTAVEKIEEQREPAASTLAQAAGTVHKRTEELARKTRDAGHATADALERVAGYLRQNDTNAMVEDARGLVRRYPGQFIAGAVAVGFLIGRAIRHNSV